MNQPYVKEFNTLGEITNPITLTHTYKTMYNTRRTRRQKDDRFQGNNKGSHLTVFQSLAYHRAIQVIRNAKTGVVSRIQHYIKKR